LLAARKVARASSARRIWSSVACASVVPMLTPSSRTIGAPLLLL
jgi:hypothetical protein